MLIVCSAPAAEHGLVNAVYALYYLPRRYKLVVLTDGWAEGEGEREEISSLAADEALMGRISFDSNAGMSERMSPFSFADVVLHGGERHVLHTPTARNISLQANESPEALASAILKAARA